MCPNFNNRPWERLSFLSRIKDRVKSLIHDVVGQRAVHLSEEPTFLSHSPTFSQTPVTAVSESFANHLVRPQKSRASGKEGTFKIEGLYGTCSHLPQPLREIPIWFSWLHVGSPPRELRTHFFRRENLHISCLKAGPSFPFSSIFKQKVLYAV